MFGFFKKQFALKDGQGRVRVFELQLGDPRAIPVTEAPFEVYRALVVTDHRGVAIGGWIADPAGVRWVDPEELAGLQDEEIEEVVE